MNCPRCNAKVAFVKDRCDNCGQNMVNYRKVVSTSNIYYNKGLEQAKVRDLSGAIRSLRQSLEFNKLNTNARNLLGLIYFEVGEIVSALSEWVISKHFQPEYNDADTYIREVQSNPNRLEMYNQTIRKYNAALYSAQHGDGDMAIIQLKKVVGLNPKFIRANQLLALLYMMTGKRDNKIRAKRLLTNISKIDVTNTTTIAYLKELSDIQIKGETSRKPSEEKQPEVRKTLPRVEVDAYKTITPYKEEKPSIMPFINIIIGVVIGIALMGFLGIPHIKSSMSSQENSDFKKYSEEKAANDSDAATLRSENEKLTKELEELRAANQQLTGSDTEDGTNLQESYESLIEALQDYVDGKKVSAAKKLDKVNEEALLSDKVKEIYQSIKEPVFEAASENCFLEGRDAYNGEGDYTGNRDYEKAISLLEKSLSYNPNNTDAMYFLGRCYQQQSDTEKAKEYYNKIIDEYPDSERVGEARSRLRELGE